jgi:hypothetical protein
MLPNRPPEQKEYINRSRRLKNALCRVDEDNSSLANGRPLLPQDRRLGSREIVSTLADERMRGRQLHAENA